MATETPRKATEREAALVSKLLSAHPSGTPLLEQVGRLRVTPLDKIGSLALEVDGAHSSAAVAHKFPVEGVVTDSDGYDIHILLFISGNFLSELEIYKFGPNVPLCTIRAEDVKLVMT